MRSPEAVPAQPAIPKTPTFSERFADIEEKLQDVYQDITIELESVRSLDGRHRELFVKEFLRNLVRQIIMHSDTRPEFGDFSQWLSLPRKLGASGEDTEKISEVPDVWDGWQDNDLPSIRHPYVQLQVLMMKQVEAGILTGGLVVPKPGTGGTIDIDMYRSFIDGNPKLLEYLRNAIALCNELIRKPSEPDNHTENRYVSFFDYDLRNELARTKGYRWIGRFRAYHERFGESDLALAAQDDLENADAATDRYVLIRRDGTLLHQDSVTEIDYAEKKPSFEGGFFRINKSDRIRAYLRPDGTELRTPKPLNRAEPFQHGVATVEEEAGHNILRPDGSFVFSEPQPRWIRSVSQEGLVLVKQDERAQGINYLNVHTGAFLFQNWQTNGTYGDFHNGYAVVQNGTELNYIDTHGDRLFSQNIQLYPSYTDFTRFLRGIARIHRVGDPTPTFIRPDGSIIPLPYAKVHFPYHFAMGLVAGQNKQGEALFFDSEGRQLPHVIPNARPVSTFEKGRLSLRRGEKHNEVNLDGELLLPQDHDHVQWREGAIKCGLNGQDGAIWTVYRMDGTRVLHDYRRSVEVDEGTCVSGRETEDGTIIGEIHSCLLPEAEPKRLEPILPAEGGGQEMNVFWVPIHPSIHDGIIELGANFEQVQGDGNQYVPVFWTIHGKRIFTHNDPF